MSQVCMISCSSSAAHHGVKVTGSGCCGCDDLMQCVARPCCYADRRPCSETGCCQCTLYRVAGDGCCAPGAVLCCCRWGSCCCLSRRHSALLAGVGSVIFDVMIIVHELDIYGGFTLRNYLIIAFCVVWFIVSSMLVIGVYTRAHFLLLPWMILTCVLLPLFLTAISAGWKFIVQCSRDDSHGECEHVYHIFGTRHSVQAYTKLAILWVMFILNAISLFVVYKYFMHQNVNEVRKRQQSCDRLEPRPPSDAGYERFDDDETVDYTVPLVQTQLEDIIQTPQDACYSNAVISGEVTEVHHHHAIHDWT